MPGSVRVPGTACNDCVMPRTLPFTYNLYGQPFNSVMVGSNGTLGFLNNANGPNNTCLPYTSYSIFPYWADLNMSEYLNVNLGVYTSISGSAPNRIYNIEWRACIEDYLQTCPASVNFEVRLYEGESKFDLIYGQVEQSGTYTTVGVQKDFSTYTQFSCYQPLLSQGEGT